MTAPLRPLGHHPAIRRRISALIQLIVTLGRSTSPPTLCIGCTSPETTLDETTIYTDALDETDRGALAKEEEKVTMYSRFLLSVNEERAHHAFSHLHWHASDRSLPILRARLAGSEEPA